MLLVKKNDFEIHSASRLVKSQDVMAVTTADEIIARAEAEAERIRKEAREAFEAERRRGYDVGVEEGKAEQAERNLELARESADFMAATEGRMVDVVMKCLQKCVMEIGDSELVVAIVKKVMNAVVRNQRQITLKVAPEMVSVVKNRLNEILADYPTLDNIEVQEDARFNGTACRIETEAGIADASLETQLAAIEKSLRKHFSKEDC
ncbi:MAG: HrpE/YscL family type III secretion apparatus protein [Lentisphaeria bacterium]|nr:HrpE/YscL family type III secretion apparatus protein [Lentisphaeria bacterium]